MWWGIQVCIVYFASDNFLRGVGRYDTGFSLYGQQDMVQGNILFC